jgi:hypothetical protein
LGTIPAKRNRNLGSAEGQFMRKCVFMMVAMGILVCGPIHGEISDGLLAYWSFDAGLPVDDSGNGFDGTLMGDTEFRQGISGKGMYLDGDLDYMLVETGGNLSFQPAEESYSISLWFNIDDTSPWYSMYYLRLIQDRPPGENSPISYTLSIRPDGTMFSNIWNGYPPGISNRIEYEGPVESNRWIHLVLVVRANQSQTIFINGTPVKTTEIEGVPVQNYKSNITAIGLGWYPPNEYHCFCGTIDEVRIYDRALDSDEILMLGSVGFDNDDDSLPDFWEIEYGLDASSANGDDGPAGDPDRDGRTNLEEWESRTNPKSVELHMQVHSIELVWNSIQGVRYQVFQTESLDFPYWVPAGEPILGTGGVLKSTRLISDGDIRFFKVEALD